ncbi:MAG: MMPL family transporter, partial [Spirochaetota bacterium]
MGTTRIKADNSVDSMFPKDNKEFKLTKEVNTTFNSGTSQIIVLFADQVFTPERLNQVRALTGKLKAIKGVKSVNSLANANRLTEKDGVLESGELVARDNLSLSEIADIRVYLDTNYALKDGLLASRDGGSTNIVIQIAENVQNAPLNAKIVEAVSSVWTGRYEMEGMPVTESALMGIMTVDLPVLMLLAIVIILIFFYLNFRSLMGIFMPLLQVVVGLIWGLGLYGWSGGIFQSFTIIAPIAILSIGSSFTLHLLGRYFLELSKGAEKGVALGTMLSKTGLGVFVSGLAISASMLTFLLSGILTVRGMGLLLAFGVFSCLFSSLTFLPALLSILPVPKVRRKADNPGWLGNSLRKLGGLVAKHPKAIVIASLVIVLAAATGIPRIVPNTSTLAYFKPDSAVRRGADAVEKAFGGSTALRMVVEGDLQDPKLLAALLRYQEEIRTIQGVGPTQSLASVVRSLHETLTGEAGLPTTRELVAQELLVYQSAGSVDDMTSLATLDYSKGLVSIMISRLSTHETKVLAGKLEAKATEMIGGLAKTSFVGESLLESVVETIILKDFIISLTLAILLVIMIDSLVRSIRAALVTIIVLLSTIALQYGLLGLFGINFDLSTAMMGALAIGVGDYAIHFTVRYMEDRRRGLSPEAAIEESIVTSGRSIFFTALTLGGGFMALGISQFVPVATLGRLMVFTVVTVGVASLTLLPAACL